MMTTPRSLVCLAFAALCAAVGFAVAVRFPDWGR